MNYPEFVSGLAKPGRAIRDALTGKQADMWHAATGVAGEAGELLDAIKKHVVYGKPLDLANVVEELGDLEFYMQQLRNNLGLTREECLQANVAKLSVRYAAGAYTDQQAQDRADKNA